MLCLCITAAAKLIEYDWNTCTVVSYNPQLIQTEDISAGHKQVIPKCIHTICDPA